MIEMRLLRDALVLNTHRNFARAARALGLSQPSLSRSIAALEEQLGMPLFDRSHKGVEPTAFGRLLLERGAALLRDENALRREIELLAGLEVGILHLGIGPYAGNSAVAAAVGRLVLCHPGLHIEVVSLAPQSVVAGVLRDQFDLGVAAVEGFEQDDRLSYEALPPHPVFLVCRPGHPLTRLAKLTIAGLLRYPLVASSLRAPALQLLLEQHGQGRTDPDSGDRLPAITVNSFDLARQIAMQSDALFPGTRAMLEHDMAAGRLVRLDFQIPLMATRYGFNFLTQRTVAPAARAFMVNLRVAEREIAADDAHDVAAGQPAHARVAESGL